MCINRDDKPTTCCCGCSLTCGIILYAVLASLELLATVISGEWMSITFNVITMILLELLYLMNDSQGVRLMNYIWQCVIMGVMIIAIIAAIVGSEVLTHYICESATASQ